MKLKGSPAVWVSFAMIVGVMGTALISPLYGLYKETWGLQAGDISLIYVVYMGGALCGLLCLGRLPDRAGFLPVMRWGMVVVLIGTFICMLAWNVFSLMVGRVLVGVASSMLTTSATLGLSSLSRPGQGQRAAMLAGFLLAVGFGLGPLLGGAMGQWVPYPLVTAYAPMLVLGGLGLLALFALEMPTTASLQGLALRWRDVLPRLTWPAAHDTRPFLLTGSLPFLAFGVFSLYASMAPLFLAQMLPWHGPMISGAAVAAILLASGGVQWWAVRVPTPWCGFAGLIGLALSNALLLINLSIGSPLLFVLGVLVTAVGHGMSMVAGMSMINRFAQPGKRSGLLATFLLIGYIGAIAPMLGMGWMADRWGMNTALTTFATFVIAMGMGCAVFFQRHDRMRAVQVHP